MVTGLACSSCFRLVNWHPLCFNPCIYTWPGLKKTWHSCCENSWISKRAQWIHRELKGFCYSMSLLFLSPEDFRTVPIVNITHQYLSVFWSYRCTISIFVALLNENELFFFFLWSLVMLRSFLNTWPLYCIKYGVIHAS